MTESVNFTVVIPSRNRPVLLRAALQSVLEQTHPSFEILVVNDGSDGDNAAAYARIAEELRDRVTFLNLESTTRGHGSSGSINRGAELAKGEFLCFLDDDDFWIDKEHLARAWRALSAPGQNTDVYFSNQAAFLGDQPVLGPLWLGGLECILDGHSQPDADGIYRASLSDLMKCPGFEHLNVSIVRTSLYRAIGGMDENIRYENDWDFYLRVIDAAQGIKYFPGKTSRHNAPDPTKALNMSTVVSVQQKMLFRSYVMDKAILFAKSPEIRKAAAKSKLHTLKRIAESLVKDGRYVEARYYAREALAGGCDPKWRLYGAYLGLRAFFQS
jgi:glycosyltransferase involved in cell wall biosynthesis